MRHIAGATSFCSHTADAAQAAMTVGVANVLCDERPAPLAWPAPAPAPPAPLWQYPGEPLPMHASLVVARQVRAADARRPPAAPPAPPRHANAERRRTSVRSCCSGARIATCRLRLLSRAFF